MNKDTKQTVTATSSGGIGFVGLLTCIFVTLKLTGYISWSWWWVLSPIWISWLVFIGALVLILVAILIGVAISVWLDRRKFNARQRRNRLTH